MPTTAYEDRTLTELDHVRLSRLLRHDPRTPRDPSIPVDGPLHEVLEDADLVPSREVPADVVTMYSRVTVANADASNERVLTLCYPEDTDPTKGFVSVLSPIGAALLGRRKGELATPSAPGAAATPMLIVDILYQPEASGDYTL